VAGTLLGLLPVSLCRSPKSLTPTRTALAWKPSHNPNSLAFNNLLEITLEWHAILPLPGNVQIPFDELKGVLKYALTEVARNVQAKKAA
jgi:hypothetical protein